MPINVEVDFLKEDKFQIKALNSRSSFFIDKNKEGSASCGPNPLEIFLASLAGCIGVYSKNYLSRHAIGFKRLKIMAEAQFTTESPACLKDIVVKVDTDAQLADKKDVFLRFISNCPVHNTLLQAKEAKINLI